MKRLEGRRCIITGGGSGIGRASAERLAAEGGQVLVTGRSAGNIEETVEAIRDRDVERARTMIRLQIRKTLDAQFA